MRLSFPRRAPILLAAAFLFLVLIPNPAAAASVSLTCTEGMLTSCPGAPLGPVGFLNVAIDEDALRIRNLSVMLRAGTLQLCEGESAGCSTVSDQVTFQGFVATMFSDGEQDLAAPTGALLRVNEAVNENGLEQVIYTATNNNGSITYTITSDTPEPGGAWTALAGLMSLGAGTLRARLARRRG